MKNKRFKTNLEHRIAIINAVRDNKQVYRCLRCDNLSLDPFKEGWIVFLEKPKEPKNYTYVFDICYYCKSQNYAPREMEVKER